MKFNRILIQCATPLEFHALKDAIDSQARSQKVGKREYFSNSSESIFLLRGSVGKVWAAASAEFGIQTWKPDLVIDFGAAGALTNDLRVAELFVAEKIVEHDVYSAIGKFPLFETSFKFEALQGAKRGVLAAGDQDIETLEDREALALRVGAHVACWEALAVGRVAQFHGISFGSLRVITDFGEKELLKEYKENAKRVLKPAAQKLIEHLKNLT